jgi:lipopolysaccharide biosynthesis glycosyltransferase
MLVTNIIDKGGVLPISSTMVLTPSLEDYVAYLNLLKTFDVFGFTKCMNGYDEQSICYYYSKLKKKGWYAVHQRYNYIAWKDGFLCKGDAPKVIHYMSETKPWMIAYNTYDDVITWYKMAADALEQTGTHPTTILITAENINAAVASDDTFLNKFGISM